MLSRLDRAQEFLVVAEQRYREVCNAKEIGDAKTLRRKIKEALSILSNLDKDIDKPKDWQALFAIADEIRARKTNHLCIYAVTVDNEHTDKASWEKLLELIDKLP